MISRKKSRLKESGGRYRAGRKKRITELGRMPALTRVGKIRIKRIRTRGANLKLKGFANDMSNVYDTLTKKYSKSKIISVKENPANRHYVRRNIMTKGTIIETELGKAKVTSRPGQEGIVNAVLQK